MSDKAHESRVRRLAKRRGYLVRKSRQWKYIPHANNYGGYMLVLLNCNAVVLGSRFEATLNDIEHFFKEAA
jgi:hypothetical protein